MENVEAAARDLAPQIVHRLLDEKGSLLELNEWITGELPKTLEQRQKLSLPELERVMEWKLAMGKFRPSLRKLIKSNKEDEVEEITSKGLAEFVEFAKDKSLDTVAVDDYVKAVRSSMKTLCQLRGVGPATASLLLSLLKFTLSPPFFSDEGYLYFVEAETIKYTMKEYVNYVEVVFGMAKKSGVSMDVLHLGGWALKMYEIEKENKLAGLKYEPMKSTKEAREEVRPISDEEEQGEKSTVKTKSNDTNDSTPRKKQRR